MDKEDPYKYKGWDFNKSDKEDKTIVVYTEWKNAPKDPEEIKKALNFIHNEIIKAFEIEFWKVFGITPVDDEDDEILYGRNDGKEPQEIIYGKSPIQQARESIQKHNIIASCICCRHWIINKERTYLLGTCELSSKEISYDRVCEFWDKIN